MRASWATDIVSDQPRDAHSLSMPCGMIAAALGAVQFAKGSTVPERPTNREVMLMKFGCFLRLVLLESEVGHAGTGLVP